MRSAGTCWALPRSARLGLVVRGYPEILPVNYGVARRCVVVRTDPGLKLHHARFERACFEVDDLHLATRTGWSVLVKGRAAEIRYPDELEQAADRRPRAWGHGNEELYIGILSSAIAGWRIMADAPLGADWPG